MLTLSSWQWQLAQLSLYADETSWLEKWVDIYRTHTHTHNGYYLEYFWSNLDKCKVLNP